MNEFEEMMRGVVAEFGGQVEDTPKETPRTGDVPSFEEMLRSVEAEFSGGGRIFEEEPDTRQADEPAPVTAPENKPSGHPAPRTGSQNLFYLEDEAKGMNWAESGWSYVGAFGVRDLPKSVKGHRYAHVIKSGGVIDIWIQRV